MRQWMLQYSKCAKLHAMSPKQKHPRQSRGDGKDGNRTMGNILGLAILGGIRRHGEETAEQGKIKQHLMSRATEKDSQSNEGTHLHRLHQY